jgi:hypothetical protein
LNSLRALVQQPCRLVAMFKGSSQMMGEQQSGQVFRLLPPHHDGLLVCCVALSLILSLRSGRRRVVSLSYFRNFTEAAQVDGDDFKRLSYYVIGDTGVVLA